MPKAECEGSCADECAASTKLPVGAASLRRQLLDRGGALTRPTDHREEPRFPTAAGIFFGLGVGGFFDGIVLHQILQWHHMVSHRHPPVDLPSLQFNTLWDGIFHASTFVFVLLGLVLLWRAARRRHLRWSWMLLVGTMLIGFGAFNLVEGLVNHHILELHHVNEVVSESQRLFYDLGFLVWGAAMLIGGWGWSKTRRSRGARPKAPRSRRWVT